MRKRAKVALAAICLCVLAVAVLRPRPVSLAGGEKIIVYTPLSGPVPGGSAHADLLEELAVRYGEDGVRTKIFDCIWSDEDGIVNAEVYDTSNYEFEYLGRGLRGGNYILCTVNTARTVVCDEENMEPIPDTTRVCTCIGYDDAIPNSRARAEVIWDTLEEEYPDGEARFNLTNMEIQLKEKK